MSHCDTLPLEDRTPEAVLAMAEKLQLFDHPNQSYQAAYRQGGTCGVSRLRVRYFGRTSRATPGTACMFDRCHG
jgi:hypothetical protein